MSTAVEATPTVALVPPAPEAPAFDPTPGIIKIEGKGRQANEYLPVNWRVLWLRRDHPGATIVTDQVQISPEWAVFKATITLEDGAIGTGFGSQSAKQFAGGFLEKAETKAIGRACAALGYGTLAAFEEGEGVADSPAQRPQASAQNSAASVTDEWDWSKLKTWLRERNITDRAGLDYAARRSTEGMAPGEIHRLIRGVDKLVQMPDDKLLAIVTDAARAEGLRVGAAYEYCRRADSRGSLSARLVALGDNIPEEKLEDLVTQHQARLGLNKSAPPASPAAPRDDPPWEDVVGPPANQAAQTTEEKGRERATDAQLLALESLAKQRGLSQATILEGVKAMFPSVASLRQLTRTQAGQAIDDVRKSHPANEAAS